MSDDFYDNFYDDYAYEDDFVEDPYNFYDDDPYDIETERIFSMQDDFDFRLKEEEKREEARLVELELLAMSLEPNLNWRHRRFESWERRKCEFRRRNKRHNGRKQNRRVRGRIEA